MEIIKFVRSIDELGRIVLPVEARDQFDWDARDKIDIFMDYKKQSLTLMKTEHNCLCCHSTENLKTLPDGRHICMKCILQVK